MEKMKDINTQKLTCKKEKEDVRSDMKQQCIADTKDMEKLIKVNHMTKLAEINKTSDILTDELREQLDKRCESDKEDHANKMKIKH